MRVGDVPGVSERSVVTIDPRDTIADTVYLLKEHSIGAVVVSSDGTTILPDLATDWEISSDARQFTFTLRDGVKWHDGEDFTADDVVFTFLRAKNPPEGKTFPRLSAMKLLESVEAEGNKVVFTLSDPDVDFMLNFAGAWGIILPEHVVATQGLEGPEQIVGTGPFVIGKNTLQEFITSYSDERRTLTFDAAGLPPIVRRGRNVQSVRDHGDGTSTLTFEIDFDFRGPFKALSPIMRRRMATSLGGVQTDLKAYAEARA